MTHGTINEACQAVARHFCLAPFTKPPTILPRERQAANKVRNTYRYSSLKSFHPELIALFMHFRSNSVEKFIRRLQSTHSRELIISLLSLCILKCQAAKHLTFHLLYALTDPIISQCFFFSLPACFFNSNHMIYDTTNNKMSRVLKLIIIYWRCKHL
jgi:hypothetical protein